MSESPRLAAFLAAIDAGADERAEACALQLQSDDETALLKWVDATNLDRQWWAVRALARCGTAAAAPVIGAQLADADSSVRAAAALALAHLHARAADAVMVWLDPIAGLLLDDDGMVRQVAADSLAMCRDDAVPALARILFQQTHQGARTRAAGALRKIATMKSAGILYALLNDENHLVRAYAYEGLDEMGLLETVIVTLQ